MTSRALDLCQTHRWRTKGGRSRGRWAAGAAPGSGRTTLACPASRSLRRLAFNDFAKMIKKPRGCRRGFLVCRAERPRGGSECLRIARLCHSGGAEGLGCNSFPLCSSRRFVNRNLGRSAVSDDGVLRTNFVEYSHGRCATSAALPRGERPRRSVTIRRQALHALVERMQGLRISEHLGWSHRNAET